MTMLKKMITTGGALALAVSLAAPAAYAKVSASEAARLGTSQLTPLGAQVKGNGKDINSGLGIPDWTGGITKKDIPANYTQPGQHHPNPYESDKIAFTITSTNMDKYAAQIPGGVQALLKTYPDTFKLNVYPSRRSASSPDWVYANTKENAVKATMTETGVDGAFGGIPFPILSGSNSDKALQAVWNHIMRWRGVYVVRRAADVVVQRNGAYSLITSQQEVYFKLYDERFKQAGTGNIIFYFLSFVRAPARLAGGAVLVHETLDQKLQPRDAWGYNAGQRRVRKAPNLAYDTPIAAAEGLRTADDTDIYNGSPDRYNWRLLHDRPVEMFIPYNSYELDSNKVTYKDLLTRGHINADYQRWELHRVWVVEATLKDGQRHKYNKRVFYIDEDTWQIVVADQYQTNQITNVSLAYLKNFYEVQVMWTALEVFHDLRAGRYHAQYLDNEESTITDFSQPVPNENYFSAAALRRRGT